MITNSTTYNLYTNNNKHIRENKGYLNYKNLSCQSNNISFGVEPTSIVLSYAIRNLLNGGKKLWESWKTTQKIDLINNLGYVVDSPASKNLETLTDTLKILTKLPTTLDDKIEREAFKTAKYQIRDIKAKASQSTFLNSISDDNPVHRELKKEFLLSLYETGHYNGEKSDLCIAHLNDKYYSDFKREIARKLLYSSSYQANITQVVAARGQEKPEKILGARIAEVLDTFSHNKKLYEDFIDSNKTALNTHMENYFTHLEAKNKKISSKDQENLVWIKDLIKEGSGIRSAAGEMQNKFIKLVEMERSGEHVIIPNVIMLQGKNIKGKREVLSWLNNYQNISFVHISHDPRHPEETIENLYNVAEKSEENFAVTRKRTLIYISNLEKLLIDKHTDEGERRIADFKLFAQDCAKDYHTTLLFDTEHPEKLDSAAIAPHRVGIRLDIDKFTT